MEAKIFTQRLLDDDEMETESQISIEKIKGTANSNFEDGGCLLYMNALLTTE